MLAGCADTSMLVPNMSGCSSMLAWLLLVSLRLTCILPDSVRNDIILQFYWAVLLPVMASEVMLLRHVLCW